MLFNNLFITTVLAILVLSNRCLGQGYDPIPRGTADNVTWTIIDDPGNAGYDKLVMFANLSPQRMIAYSNSATNYGDKMVFRLLYHTFTYAYNNLTDEGLHVMVPIGGARLKRDMAKIAVKVPTAELMALERFSPEQVVIIYNAMSEPWIFQGTLPWGAYGITAASISYIEAQKETFRTAIAKRSTILKLLDANGYVVIPNSVNVDFLWSGDPTVVIDLSFTHWTRADIIWLKRLVRLKNPYYAAMAQAELNELVPPRPRK